MKAFMLKSGHAADVQEKVVEFFNFMEENGETETAIVLSSEIASAQHRKMVSENIVAEIGEILRCLDSVSKWDLNLVDSEAQNIILITRE